MDDKGRASSSLFSLWARNCCNRLLVSCSILLLPPPSLLAALVSHERPDADAAPPPSSKSGGLEPTESVEPKGGEGSAERKPACVVRSETCEAPSCTSSSSSGPSGSGLVQPRRMHACFLMPLPPNLGLSLQFLHAPQSPRKHPAHEPQRFVRPRLAPRSSAEGGMLLLAPCRSMQHSTALQKASHSWGGMLPRASPEPTGCCGGTAGLELEPPLGVGAAAGWRHLRSRQLCLRMPLPPNLGLSRQFRHAPQSLRQQASH
mmetsp:Transcript_13716/g.27576  ORF Transcript_13716/g.27576 Transcript_13716/m.27576 type:complete len:260 (+) Transcript_13716:760-1539(+)